MKTPPKTKTTKIGGSIGLFLQFQSRIFESFISMFSFSLKLQGLYLLFFVTSMKAIQLPIIATFVDQILLGWMDNNRQDVHDFVPMTYHCWFFHYTMMLIGIEMIITLGKKMKIKKKNQATTTMTKKNSKTKNNGNSTDSNNDNNSNNHLVSTMYYIFILNGIQGHLTCLSHACIDIHPILENKLNTLAYKLFLPTAVFLTGIIGIIGSAQLRAVCWYVLTPIMAYGTYTNHIGFHTILGRALSTLSLLVVLFCPKRHGLNLLFKVGYTLLSMTPMIPNLDDGSDTGHTNVAILITIFQFILWKGIDVVVEEDVEEDVEGDSTSSSSSIQYNQPQKKEKKVV